jgi:hypothetical protein
MLSFIDVYRNTEISYRFVLLPDDTLSVEILEEVPAPAAVGAWADLFKGSTPGKESTRAWLLSSISDRMAGFESWLPDFQAKLRTEGLTWQREIKAFVGEKYMLRMADVEIVSLYRIRSGGNAI